MGVNGMEVPIHKYQWVVNIEHCLGVTCFTTYVALYSYHNCLYLVCKRLSLRYLIDLLQNIECHCIV